MKRSTEEENAPTGTSRRAVLTSFGAAGILAATAPLLSSTAAHADTAGSSVAIDWHTSGTICRTSPTLQVVVNPLLRRGSPIHRNAFRALQQLRTEYVRFVPWFPYPKLGVAELEPPDDGRTSWDLSLIDPLVEDFERATRGRSTILNFSTIPEWMWQPTPWTIQDGALHVVGGDNAIAASGAAWTDYTFAADVTPQQTGAQSGASYAQAGLLLRMQDADNGYGVLLSNYPYADPAESGYVVLLVFRSGQPVAVTPTALPFAVVGGTTYHVEATVRGSSLTVDVDGTTVLTVADQTFAAGTVGFREDGSESADFDNVTVTDAATGSTLLADDFSGDLGKWMPPVAYPADPDAPDFGYSQGQQLAVPVETVADYYRRLVSWYSAGGFTDEAGRFHRSGHHYEVPYWEVLNEVDAEHTLSPQDYTTLYDAIVTAIREVSPRTKFVGLALANAADLDYYRYFLDPANHRHGVPLDLISYHFYAQPNPTDTADDYGPDGFAQADNFITTVGQIEDIRKSLAPHVRTTIDEIGTILPGSATQADPAPIPDAYWNFSGGIYAYLFAKLALMGIDILGESQLVGYPSQYPSVSMVDWTTGTPNARYRVLELILDELRPGCRLIEIDDSISPSGVHALAVRDGRQHKVLLINKTNADVSVDIHGLHGAHVRIVDQHSGGGPIRAEQVRGPSLTLGGYAVAVAALAI